MYKMLVFIKGKTKPVLFESVLTFDTTDGVLKIRFKDGSSCMLARDWWHECDVEVMKPETVVIQDRQVPVESQSAAPENIPGVDSEVSL